MNTEYAKKFHDGSRDINTRMLGDVAARIETLNSVLFSLSERLFQIQPVQAGKIVLQPAVCGPKCSGCPHFTWAVKRQKVDKDRRKFLANIPVKSRISMYVKTTGDFEDCAAEVAALVRRAEQLIDLKAKYVDSVSRFSKSYRALKAVEEKLFDSFTAN